LEGSSPQPLTHLICLPEKRQVQHKQYNHEEKLHNWKVFTNLMLSTWINIFDPENNLIKNIKNQWKEIIEQSFLNNTFNQELYNKGYYETFGAKVKGGRLISFVNFYQISLLANYLNKNIEKEYFEYILNYPTGIYYVYDKKLMEIPEIFQSKYTSRFIGAIELLSDYNNVECKKQLKYIVKWLEDNKITRNKWDLGKDTKDGIYFPLCDSWRKEEDRIMDCTNRIEKLMERINV
jgi:hypothetical protein